MNFSLLKEIVSHVMANFGIIPSNFINHNKTDSLLNPIYLLNDKIVYELEGKEHQGKMWGCQMGLSKMKEISEISNIPEIKILLGDCTIDKEFPEFAMVIQSKNAPVYGLYLCHNELGSNPKDSFPNLSVSLNGKNWMDCHTYLQATFLAAMEQTRELKFPWTKCSDYQSLYQTFVSFLNHIDDKFGN